MEREGIACSWLTSRCASTHSQVMLLKIEVGKDDSLADGIKAALRKSTVQHCEVCSGSDGRM